MGIENLIKEQIREELLTLKEALKQELLQDFKIISSPWLSRIEAAEYLGVCLASIDNYVKAGRLEKFKISRSTKFKKSDLDNLLK